MNYFAYGSNMNSAQMRERCSTASFLCVARLPEHRFIINSRGVATVVRLDGSSVVGVLWRLTEQDKRSLDVREGVFRGVYSVNDVVVTGYDGVAYDAFIYIDPISTTGSPRPNYLERVVAGAKEFGIDNSYISDLELWRA